MRQCVESYPSLRNFHIVCNESRINSVISSAPFLHLMILNLRGILANCADGDLSLSLSLCSNKRVVVKYEYILVVLVYNNICSCTYTEPHQPTKPSCWFTCDCDPSNFNTNESVHSGRGVRLFITGISRPAIRPLGTVGSGGKRGILGGRAYFPFWSVLRYGM